MLAVKNSMKRRLARSPSGFQHMIKDVFIHCMLGASLAALT
jgi:hypothetical protein